MSDEWNLEKLSTPIAKINEYKKKVWLVRLPVFKLKPAFANLLKLRPTDRNLI